MRLSLVSVASVSACLACVPGPLGSSEGSETGDSTSTSSDSTTDSGAQTETSGDGDDEPPDVCPATPELGSSKVRLDGDDFAIDFRELDGRLEWTHACTVASISGTLASGETIGLDCVDAEGQAVAHTIELLFEVDGAPLEAPVSVGQALELSLWVEVWFSGTAAWTLRDADGELLLLHYNGPYLPSPDNDDYAPFPEFIAPLSVAVDTEVCPLVCPEEEPSTFVPSDECCSKETALVLDLGSGPTTILNSSAGAIPGAAETFAVVRSSGLTDLSTCEVVDASSEFYMFAVMFGL